MTSVPDFSSVKQTLPPSLLFKDILLQCYVILSIFRTLPRYSHRTTDPTSKETLQIKQEQQMPTDNSVIRGTYSPYKKDTTILLTKKAPGIPRDFLALEKPVCAIVF